MFRGYVSTRRRNMAFSCASGQWFSNSIVRRVKRKPGIIRSAGLRTGGGGQGGDLRTCTSGQSGWNCWAGTRLWELLLRRSYLWWYLHSNTEFLILDSKVSIHHS
jgi:hypothetical protein